MSNLYLVFSRKPDWIGRDEYHDWYAEHAQENIESAGFTSAQRYVVREVQNGRAVAEEQHLCVYGYDGDMQTWRDDLTRRCTAAMRRGGRGIHPDTVYSIVERWHGRTTPGVQPPEVIQPLDGGADNHDNDRSDR